MPPFSSFSKKAQCIHEQHVVGSGKSAVENPSFKWVNTILGNVKNSLRGTFHAFEKKHIPRYLAEFQYRFNRRFDLKTLVPRLAYIAVRTPPMPERLLTLAEKEW
ncbi:MAG: transposase [Deltaproteobacteria bacterium]|nr:transposase [Deltaproteobacteria bacterium]